MLVKYYHKTSIKLNSLENQALRKIQYGTVEILEASIYIRSYQVGTHMLQSQIHNQTVLGDISVTREGAENWFKLRLNLLCIFIFSTI